MALCMLLITTLCPMDALLWVQLLYVEAVSYVVNKEGEFCMMIVITYTS